MNHKNFKKYCDELLEKNTKLFGNITEGYSYVDTDYNSRFNDKLEKECAMKDEILVSRLLLKDLLNSTYGLMRPLTEIENVIFNDPATIVFWKDGIKTVVKCGKDEVFDPEKGLAMAIAKRAFGNRGNYYKVFKKWLPEEEELESDSNSVETSDELDQSCVMVDATFPEFITLGEYCERYKITVNKAYKMIKNGDLRAVKDEKGKWIIPIN